MIKLVKYYPYGDRLESQGDLATDRLFTGQRLDSTGLYYYGARYYDPTIGRFISPDTIVQNPANPQTLNRYSYALNNPLRYIDPDGRQGYDWYTAMVTLAQQRPDFSSYNNIQSFGNDQLVWELSFVSGAYGLADEMPKTTTVATQKNPRTDQPTWMQIFDPFGAEAGLQLLYDKAKSYLQNASWLRGFNSFNEEYVTPTIDKYGIGISFGMGLPLEDAGGFESIASDANKLHHIFDNPVHNMGALTKTFGGSQTQAARALEVATQNYVNTNGIQGIFDKIVVNVNGVDITVSGTVLNGQARIGTAFIH
jgi:RHS repeat-associated protein